MHDIVTRTLSAGAFAAFGAAAILMLAGCGDDASEPHHRQRGEPEARNAERDDEHGDHSEHAGEDDDAHAGVRLTRAQQAELGIALGEADTGPVDAWIELPGEVRFDENRIALVSPPVEGIIREVHASIGDVVSEGDLLAVLDSRELAEAKAAYLSALASLELVRPEFERERELFDRGVSTESRFQTARRELEEARIAVRSAEYQLDALGIDADMREGLSSPDAEALSRFSLEAPMDGVVTERHAVRGEVTEAGDVEPTFVIADASRVWIDAAIYGPDMLRVAAGSPARIRLASGEPIETAVSFVAPQLGEATRTGLARLIVDNAEGRLVPGAFVTVEIADADAASVVRVPAAAVQTLGGETVVFAPEDDGFEAHEVRLGRRGPDFVEIVSGLEAGDALVVEGAFALKAEMQKGEFGDGHAH